MHDSVLCSDVYCSDEIQRCVSRLKGLNFNGMGKVWTDFYEELGSSWVPSIELDPRAPLTGGARYDSGNLSYKFLDNITNSFFQMSGSWI